MVYLYTVYFSPTRSPLGELDTNTPSGPVPVCKRRTLLARRLKKRLSSPLAGDYKINSLQENTTMNISSTENKLPHLSTARPSSFPSFTQSQQTGSGDSLLTRSFQGSGRSWIRQISSPLVGNLYCRSVNTHIVHHSVYLSMV